MNEETVKFFIEVKESLARIEGQISVQNQKIDTLEEKVDGMTTNINIYKDKADEAYIISKESERRLNKIESNIQWLWRTGIGAIIVGAIGLYFKFK